MTNKRKTYAELEESRNDWRFWCIAFIFLFMVFFILFIKYSENSSSLESQLKTCKENVEVWSFNVWCDFSPYDKFNSTHYFDDYSLYLDKIEFYEMLDCEVIE